MSTKLFLTIIALCMTSLCIAQEKTPIVETKSGKVQGIMQEGTMAFLGIPYATVERFMPPKPVKPWTDVRMCDHWGPQAMQQVNRPMSEDEMSEQCCKLNVWTPYIQPRPAGAHIKPAEPKPVMVWLHGGGFDSGTPAWDPGMWLAKKDVVVVSVAHRLNILGFLDLSTCGEKYKHSGNVGMLDVVQALQWVRNNISKFGGDPYNDHLWRVRWWRQSGHSALHASSQGTFPQGHHHERHHPEREHEGDDGGTG